MSLRPTTIDFNNRLVISSLIRRRDSRELWSDIVSDLIRRSTSVQCKWGCGLTQPAYIFLQENLLQDSDLSIMAA